MVVLVAGVLILIGILIEEKGAWGAEQEGMNLVVIF